MAQTKIDFRMISELKSQMDKTCDPFYSSSNMEYLEKIISDIDNGKAKVTEYQLIEEE